MSRSWIVAVFTAFAFLANGQAYQLITCGPGYNKQSYINLKNGTEKLVANDAWDLAFTAFSFQDAGIFINESSGSTQGQNLPLTELYDAHVTDFNATITLDSITNSRFLNSEKSWSYGAFNEPRSLADPFDFGWGKYIPSGQRVAGEKIYVLKLRNGRYKKIKIESLIGTTYTIKYANLDGSEEVVKTINKMPVRPTKLIYFSMTTNEVVDVMPTDGFDLMYGRYISLAKDPNGTIEQQYNVTGILTGPGVQAVAAKGIDPETVSHLDYANSYSSQTDIIGYDWKTLVGTSWSIAKDRVYFVKTAENRVWKIVIIDFEGSSTGNAVFVKTDLGISSVDVLEDAETNISPNPVSEILHIAIDAKSQTSNNFSIEVIDMAGKQIHKEYKQGLNGFNVIDVNAEKWKPGMYIVKISNDKNQTSVGKIIKH